MKQRALHKRFSLYFPFVCRLCLIRAKIKRKSPDKGKRSERRKFVRVFDYCALSEKLWETEIVNYTNLIHEYKGKQELYIRQNPMKLEKLVEIAKIQSTESSNRIERIVTTASRIRALVQEKRRQGTGMSMRLLDTGMC